MEHLESMSIETLELDVTSSESCSSCVEAVTKLTGGSLDILVNNAGGGFNMPLVDADIEEAKRLFDTNVWGVLRVTQAFLPLLLKSKHPRGPLVVNHSSIVSVINNPWQGIYNSSKAATAMMTDTMRLELMPFGVKVVDLKTGTVATEFWTNQANRVAPRLPENSIYKPAAEMFEKILRDGPDNVEHTPAKAWAQDVVRDLLKSNPAPHIWRGSNALLCWFLNAMVPHTWRDGMLLRMNKFDVLKESLRRTKS
ncbi:MAG: hypothetical protein M1821_007229 [Bathelium mastoideum]|nr:MAG: hypothetical protein M1821_007229 [Bathelium mastoideum]